MASAIADIVSRLLDVGFYDFLLFLLALPLFFAVLKKTKILGESPVTNGLVAFVGAFLVFSFPIITGVSMTFTMTNLFMQLMMFMLVMFVAMLIASFFYPDLWGFIKERFTHRTMLYVSLAIGFVIAIASGLLSTVFSALSGPNTPPGPVLSPDISNFAVGIIIFIVVLVIAMAATTQARG